MNDNALLLVLLGSGFSAALVSGIVQIVMWRLNRKAAKEEKCDNSNKQIKVALKLLMYDRIKHLAEKYITDEEIYAEDLEILIEMHECYSNDLDGNGYLKKLMERINALPIKNV